MSDSVWFIIVGILFVLLGAVFINLGWQIRKKQRMELIISYHSDKVSEANRQAYCMLFGNGIIVMGTGFLLSGIGTVLTRTVNVFIPMTVGLVFGLAMLSSAVIKYNH